MTITPTNTSESDLALDTVTIYHSRKGALVFGILLVGLIIATIAMFWYLTNETSENIPTGLIVAFSTIYVIGLHVLKGLLVDAGKVALTIGSNGVKFDRYHLIDWQDIEDVYFVEESDGPDTLWLDVKEGVNFFPSGPRPLLWLAKISGLNRSIDVSGYGTFTMKDTDIFVLLKNRYEDSKK